MGFLDVHYGGLNVSYCSSPISQSSMKFMISIGSKSNNAPFLGLILFGGPSSYNNISVGCFVIISLCHGDLGISCYQLLHASMGAVPQPLGAIIGTGSRKTCDEALVDFCE